MSLDRAPRRPVAALNWLRAHDSVAAKALDGILEIRSPALVEDRAVADREVDSAFHQRVREVRESLLRLPLAGTLKEEDSLPLSIRGQDSSVDRRLVGGALRGEVSDDSSNELVSVG